MMLLSKYKLNFPRWFARLCLLACLPFAAHAQLPENNPVPGGVAVVRLDVANTYAPTARYGNRRVAVLRDEENWYAIIGLSSTSMPGEYILMVTADGGSDAEVNTPKRFHIEALAPPNSRKVTQLPDAFALPSFTPAAIENKHGLSATLSEYEKQPTFLLRAAVDVRHAFPYGFLISKNLPDKYVNHSLVTYFASVNALIHSPAAGLVHQIQPLDTDTTIAYVNHGRGLTSVLAYTGKTIVKPGQEIQAGQPIGVVAPLPKQTNGRVEWGLLLNGNLVDPLPFTLSP